MRTRLTCWRGLASTLKAAAARRVVRVIACMIADVDEMEKDGRREEVVVEKAVEDESGGGDDEMKR